MRGGNPSASDHSYLLGITTLAEPVWDVSDSGSRFSSDEGVQQGAQYGIMQGEEGVRSCTLAQDMGVLRR